jgi:hypothetical protein
MNWSRKSWDRFQYDFRRTSFLLNWLWVDRVDVEFSVRVVHTNKTTFIDSKHSSEPLGNRDLKLVALDFGDPSGTLDKFSPARLEGNS